MSKHVGILCLFVNCVLLGAFFFFGLCTVCKNTHGVSNKTLNEVYSEFFQSLTSKAGTASELRS